MKLSKIQIRAPLFCSRVDNTTCMEPEEKTAGIDADGMLFHDLNQSLKLAIHAPNQ